MSRLVIVLPTYLVCMCLFVFFTKFNTHVYNSSNNVVSSESIEEVGVGVGVGGYG